jgi:hypothetical protein
VDQIELDDVHRRNALAINRSPSNIRTITDVLSEFLKRRVT